MDPIKPPHRTRSNRLPINNVGRVSQSQGVSIVNREIKESMVGRKSDVHIAVMGVTGAGKSSFISLLCDEKIEIGHDLKACTSVVDVYPCNLYPGQAVYLVDTPGFDDTDRSDTEVLREIAAWLTDSYANNVKLNGIIYIHRISDIRMQGSAKKNLMLFKKLCGEDALKNVVLATSMWDKVPPDEAQKREDQLKSTPEFWGWMMSKGSKTYRHDNSEESARGLLQHFLPMDKTILALQDDMVNKNQTLDETGVGRELEDVLAKEREKFTKQLLEAQEQMREAIKQRDQESVESIRELQDQYEAHMSRLEKDRQALKISMEKLHQERYNELKAKMEAQQRDLMQKQEEKQRIQEEKHRMEMEVLREKHKQELHNAQAEIAKLKVSQSRLPNAGSVSQHSATPLLPLVNSNVTENTVLSVDNRPGALRPPDHMRWNSTSISSLPQPDFTDKPYSNKGGKNQALRGTQLLRIILDSVENLPKLGTMVIRPTNVCVAIYVDGKWASNTSTKLATINPHWSEAFILRGTRTSKISFGIVDQTPSTRSYHQLPVMETEPREIPIVAGPYRPLILPLGKQALLHVRIYPWNGDDEAVALSSFYGKKPWEMSFSKGDIITVLRQVDEKLDWWEGKIGRRTGTFPGSVIDLLDKMSTQLTQE